MQDYELVFLLKPPGFFGLPEQDKTVFPTSEGGIVTPMLDTLTGEFVGYGTLPKYRESPVEETFTIGEAHLKIRDNFLFVSLKADEDRPAIQYGATLAKRFSILLSVNYGMYFYAEMLQAVNNTKQRPVQTQKQAHLGGAILYNLESLSEVIRESGATCSVWDQILDKACAYFYHALFLSVGTTRLFTSPSFHAALVTSEIILNYFKSASTILGDPSSDKDYQSRYKRFGISKDVWDDVDRLRELRNDYDIAHYTQDWKALKDIKKHQHFAEQTSRKVIRGYIAWRKPNGE